MKLNLGSGSFPLDDYVNLDRKTGQDIYPLAYPDNSVSEIYASHVLEHFSHQLTDKVLAEWVRVLEPGGILRIAVPDFRKIAQWYQEKRRDLPLQSYLVGGQEDAEDYHKAVFDEARLRWCLTNAGLVDVKLWTSDAPDNSSFEVSLNLQGTKPLPNDVWPENWPLSEAKNIYSQYGEDGILAAIFKKLGGELRGYCVDVGAADGTLFSNVRNLIENYGWSALLIEADPTRFGSLQQTMNHLLVSWSSVAGPEPDIKCCPYKVEVSGDHSLDAILERAGVPTEFDLLSIDIDGQDYYVWNSLLKFHPRVVVIEYDPNADPMFIPPLGGSGQAGWNAMTYVGAGRGYQCIAQTQTNLICVRRDLLAKIGGKVEVVERGSTLELPQGESANPVNITAVMSVPRLGYNDTWGCIFAALMSLGIKIQKVSGVFWGQCMTRGIEKAMDAGAEQILTIDYDSVFDVSHVAKMCQLLADHPEYDAIVPVQVKRESEQVLFKLNGSRDFTQEITPILTGHFGLTVFDVNTFKKMPKPWFLDIPSPDGAWNDGRVDCDIHFWHQMTAAGLKIGLANQVRIGHLETIVTWPDTRFRRFQQSVTDYNERGTPKESIGPVQIEEIR